MEAANEAARRAVNGILDAAASGAARCGVWQLHEPEIFAPWRELDFIRHSRGLPWDDTLVRFGMSVAELADKTIEALERGSDEHTAVTPSPSGLPLPHRALLSLADGSDRAGTFSDLRRDGTALVERVVRLLAIRLAETEGMRRSDPAANTYRASGKVAIIPK
jgi:hypothetical protein